MAPIRKNARPSSGSSRIGRLAKFFFTVYLLLAILYTAWHFFLLPTSRIVFGGGVSNIEMNAVVASAAGKGASVKNAIAATATTSKLKHAALETAGVKAADIRNEDASDPVWQAAEAAEKKGKSGKGKVPPYVRPDNLISGQELALKRMKGLDGAEWDQDKMNWYHPEYNKAHSGPPSAPAPYEDKSPKVLSEDHFLSLSFSNALQPSKVIPYYYRASEPDRPDFNKEDVTITTLVTSNRFEVFQRLVERYQGALRDEQPPR